MRYFITKLNDDNDYKIISEVEDIFGGNNNPNATGYFGGYISNVDWDDAEIREKMKKIGVGERIEEFR